MMMMIICVPHVTSQRPCHMLPRGARATCYLLARVTFCAMLCFAILLYAMLDDGILCKGGVRVTCYPVACVTISFGDAKEHDHMSSHSHARSSASIKRVGGHVRGAKQKQIKAKRGPPGASPRARANAKQCALLAALHSWCRTACACRPGR